MLVDMNQIKSNEVIIWKVIKNIFIRVFNGNIWINKYNQLKDKYGC